MIIGKWIMIAMFWTAGHSVQGDPQKTFGLATNSVQECIDAQHQVVDEVKKTTPKTVVGTKCIPEDEWAKDQFTGPNVINYNYAGGRHANNL